LATRKIPVTVITGFLGVGKTSLIRHLMTNAGGRRLALIINEFGELGVDGDLLRACGDETCREEDLVELTNGCICCTVADDFIPTLEMLLEREARPDHIIIETSGLALPKPLVKAFQWPQVRSRTTVDSVIVVVDGPAVHGGQFAADPDALQAQRAADETLDHDSPLEEVFADQLACADMVLISKTDLMDETSRTAVREHIQSQVGKQVPILQVRNGVAEPDAVLGIGAAAEGDIENRPSRHDGEDGDHDHDDFESIVIDLEAVQDPAVLAARIEAALGVEGVLRAKGVAAVIGKNARLVLQGVGARLDHYYDRPWNEGEERRGRVVVIGLKGFDLAAVTSALAG
jgi:cobalamin biosynthesis protein CobW